MSVKHAEAPLFDQNQLEWTYPEGVKHFLTWYAPFIGAPSDDMSATFWANRYSSFIAFMHWCVAKGYAFPINHQFSQQASIRTRELWGQVYHAIPYFKDLVLVNESEDCQHRFNHDWTFITQEAEPSIFLEKKPPFRFKTRAIKHPLNEQKIYTKPTCCLNYKNPEQSYFFRCPRLTEPQREAYTLHEQATPGKNSLSKSNTST